MHLAQSPQEQLQKNPKLMQAAMEMAMHGDAAAAKYMADEDEELLVHHFNPVVLDGCDFKGRYAAAHHRGPVLSV